MGSGLFHQVVAEGVRKAQLAKGWKLMGHVAQRGRILAFPASDFAFTWRFKVLEWVGWSGQCHHGYKFIGLNKDSDTFVTHLPSFLGASKDLGLRLGYPYQLVLATEYMHKLGFENLLTLGANPDPSPH